MEKHIRDLYMIARRGINLWFASFMAFILRMKTRESLGNPTRRNIGRYLLPYSKNRCKGNEIVPPWLT